MHVLIADDDRVTTQLVSSLLKAAGFNVTVAQDGMQAVMMAMRNVPDAIVLDIGMPGGSGLHVLERLKASNKTSGIPVIVLTVQSDPDLPARARALGAEVFLRKPVAPDELRAALDRLLRKPPTSAAGS